MKKDYIIVNNLTHTYGDFVALNNISFGVKKGDIAAIIGPNGCGKRTLLKHIVGLCDTKKDVIRIGGKHPKDMRKHIGYVPQHFTFDRTIPITVQEFMALESCAKIEHECKNIKKALRAVGMQKFARQKLGTLSGGQFQRVMVARALLHEKDILVFDEPATGVDVAGEQTIYDLMKHINKERGSTCIIVSHDLSIVSSYVNTVICINKTLVCQGSPEKVITPKKLKALFGAATGVYHSH